MSGKRFEISKLYQGPPLTTPWGGIAEGIYETVEQYNDELTARVRVAVLNEGLAQKKYFLNGCTDAENDVWTEVDDDDES